MTHPTEAPMANAIDDVKLLPCPFCGGEGAYQTDTEEEDFSEEWIGCLECGATTALEIWNRRSSPAPSQHTGWSDEAVEAFDRALEAAPSMDPYDGRRQLLIAGVKLRAALSAASSIAPATGFEVAKLEWEDSGEGEWTAETITGSYYLPLQAGDVFNVLFRGVEFQTCLAEKVGEDEAKAIAQADFDRRIRSSISPSVSKESGEP